uniref:HDC13467 n=1 Tax=Drosophila melanogaster TaxID=7227 RepID=Q6IK37_DROME|nr:TPA_inf: HDC13467 [Drosophila melanogaster]
MVSMMMTMMMMTRLWLWLLVFGPPPPPLLPLMRHGATKVATTVAAIHLPKNQISARVVIW